MAPQCPSRNLSPLTQNASIVFSSSRLGRRPEGIRHDVLVRRPRQRDRLVRTLLTAALLLLSTTVRAADCPAFLNHDFDRLHSSQSVNLCGLPPGRALLIVNTASHCGYTPQFKGLETLHRKYQARGLVVVGFPSNDFRQEAKDEAKTADICYLNYGVTFTMLAPSVVTGTGANPVFRELNGRAGEPSWNFNKYLVSGDGKTVQRFDSSVTPDAPELTRAVEKLLN